MTDRKINLETLVFRPVEDKAPITGLMLKHWGSPRMLVGMHTYDVAEIEAHGLFTPEGELVAFASWKQRNRHLVLCALHATVEGQGLAGLMLEHVKTLGREIGTRAIRAMVSNDNMPGLVFYQKAGFRLLMLYAGAVDAYRPVMPGMITHGYLGIPVHDALELEFKL